MGNGPYMADLPIKHGDFPWQTVVSHNQMLVFEELQWPEISKDHERPIECPVVYCLLNIAIVEDGLLLLMWRRILNEKHSFALIRTVSSLVLGCAMDETLNLRPIRSIKCIINCSIAQRDTTCICCGQSFSPWFSDTGQTVHIEIAAVSYVWIFIPQSYAMFIYVPHVFVWILAPHWHGSFKNSVFGKIWEVQNALIVVIMYPLVL